MPLLLVDLDNTLDPQAESGLLAELRGGLVRQIVPLAGAWMIGDSAEADINGARTAGLPGIWLHRGRPWPLTACEPSHVADSFPHAVDIVVAAGE